MDFQPNPYQSKNCNISSPCIECSKFGTYLSITVVFLGYILASVLLLSCFMRAPYLLYRLKLMAFPQIQTNP